MKITKYKIERNKLDDALNTLEILSRRSRILMAHIIEENYDNTFYYQLIFYYNKTTADYQSEISKLLLQQGKTFIVQKEQVEKFSSYKKIMDEIELVLEMRGKYSLRLH